MRVAFSRATRYLGGNAAANHDNYSQRLLPGSTPIGAEVQNQKAASVYIFGDADVTEDEVNTDCDAAEMHELRPRGRTAKRYGEGRIEPEIDYFERPVGKDDTLQSMALKYGCQVTQLKQANNLIRDQDFFALKTVKVPVKRFSLITELIAEEESQASAERPQTAPPRTSPDAVFYDEANDDSDEDCQFLVRTLSIPRSARSGNQSRAAQQFLASMDADIKRIVSSTNSRKDSLDEVASTLTRRQIKPMSKSSVVGADCGVSWWSVVVLMFCIGLLVPCLFFLYYEYLHSSSSDESLLPAAKSDVFIPDDSA